MRKYSLIPLLLFTLSSGIGHAAQYDATLNFQSDDQSMWTQGEAAMFNWRQDITLYSWNYTYETPKAYIDGGASWLSTNQYSVYGHTDGLVGFSPYINIDSGSVDLSYDVAVNILYPDAATVKPGDTFTLSTSYNSLSTGTFTTNFPEIKAGVDLLFETHSSVGLNEYSKYPIYTYFLGIPIDTDTGWNTVPTQIELVSVDIDPDTGIAANALGVSVGPFDSDLVYDEEGRIPGIEFHNDEISLLGQTVADLGNGVSLFGYGEVALNVPDIDTTGNEATGFTSTGSDDLFRVSIDADKIATDIIEAAIEAAIAAGTAGTSAGASVAIDLPDLEGSTNLEPILGETLASFIPINISYNLLDLEPFIDVDVAQTFTFSPEDLMVYFDMGNGMFTDPVAVGQDIELTMPEEGLEITPIFFLPDSTLSNLTELLIDFGLDITPP